MTKRNKISRYFVFSLILSFCSGFSATSVMAADLSQTPLNLASTVDANILINMSVETPMGGAAYNDQNDTGVGGSCSGRIWDEDWYWNGSDWEYYGGWVGACYSHANTYVGYFDPDKCYSYVTSSGGYFTPTVTPASSHACSGAFSGNFMNWATMTAMDAFVYTMTGGNRVVDTAAMTIVERAKKYNNDNWFPRKLVGATINEDIATVTPYSSATSKVHITSGDWTVGFGSYFGWNDLSSGSLNVRVRVCETAANKEDNCVQHTDGGTTYYKPEGLIQENSDNKRFAVSSYLKANTIAKNGGVLRALMKYVGPEMPAPFGASTANGAAEWGSDGLYIDDPDKQAGSNGIVYSGVINYINKFTREHGHKEYDPVSELFYESVHYFRGQDYSNAGPTSEYLPATDDEYGHFPAYSTWDDPIIYWCQKNFIVAINDSFPHRDKRVPGSNFTCPYAGEGGDGADDCGQPADADTFFDAGTWTANIHGIEPGTDIALDMAWANGATAPASNGRHNSNYIAGLAYQVHVNDLRPGITDFKGDQTITTFMIDTQEYNSDPLDDNKSPLWLTGKYGGFIDTLVVDTDGDTIPDKGNGVFDSADVWDADGDGFPDNYVLATEPSRIVSALNKTFTEIDKRDSSSAAVVANSVRLTTGTQVYQAKFSSYDWSGDMVALPIDAAGTVGAAAWHARDIIEAQSGRNIFTYDPALGNGTQFSWSTLTVAQKDALDINPDSLTDDDDGQDRLNYIRGSHSEEVDNGGVFRNRDYKLGDFINSEPVYVGAPSFGYPDTLVDVAGGDEAYHTFATTYSARTPIIYVGGNDGMLHAIRAATVYDTDGTTVLNSGGEELMAYIPGFLVPKLNELTSPNYAHRYYVDGNATSGDAFFDSAGGSDDTWHTLLAGGARAGGQGYYLLDITNPSNFTQDVTNATNLALWEFTDADDADLGYSFSQPSIVKMQNDEWAVIFGNGYHNTETDGTPSTTGNAVLYILFIEKGVDGTWSAGDFIKIDTGAGDVANPNGLSSPSAVDVDGDNLIDYIYAGDLYGNMWKFDVDNKLTKKWVVEDSKPLFSAGATQPITVKPDIGLHPLGGYMVHFGTGKYFEDGDNNPDNYGPQTFYAVWDNPDGDKEIVKGALQKQGVVTTVSAVAGTFRITSNHGVDWDTQNGWYMDLPEEGELVVADPQLNHGNIVFVTQTPSSDPCDAGGSSWLMEVSAVTGGWPEGANFDTNGDGFVDDADYLDDDGDEETAGKPGTGYQDDHDGGTDTRPTIISAGDKEFKFMSESSGGVDKVIEDAGIGTGRQSWEQIR